MIDTVLVFIEDVTFALAGLKHVVSAGPSGPRRPPHPHPTNLGIPAVPPGLLPQYGRAGPDGLRRGPPHRPPALSPPGSRV